MLYNLNDYEGAKHRLETALERAESRQDLEWIKRFRYHLGLVLSDMEKYEEALRVLQQGLEITPKEDGLFTVSFKLLIGKCFIRLELYDRAQLQLEECLEIQHRENILADLRYTHFYLGMLFSYQARYPEARPHYELALDLAKAQREQGLLADLKSDLGEVLVHLGEVDQGKSLIEQAQALAEKIGNQDLVRYIQEDLWPSLAPLLP
jgi:tetratricopeptide (TPR) repeat protein